MTNRALETSPQIYARSGGVLYLIVIVAGIFAEFFVRGKLVVSGDATATANNIMASESLWRAGFASDLIMIVCYVAVTLVLFVLLKPVNRNLSLLAAFFGMMGNAVLGIIALGHFAPLLILGGADYLKAVDPHQLQAFALLSLKIHGYGYDISVLFFDFYCLLLGYLIFRSGYLPKFVGVLFLIGAPCDLINSFALFLAPTFADSLSPAISMPLFIAELSLTLWLIVKGVNVPKWEERANRLAS